MALGYCPALLMHMKYVIGENAPEHKITPAGALKMFLEKGVQAKPIGDPFELSNVNGHIKNLRLKYYTRTTPAQMSTSDDCEIEQIPEYSEIEIEDTSVVKFGLHFNDETIARYCDEASRSVAMGKAPSAFMQEHLAGLMAALPGFVGKIDQTILSNLTWGVNAVTGNNSAVTVNFNDDSTTNLFSEGWTKVLSDYAVNEGFGKPQVMGSGLINSAAIQARIPGMTQYAQLNNNAAQGEIDFYHDINAATIMGANQFGVFMPGTFGLVQLDEYVGFRQAINMPKGTSYFFNMPVPVEMPGSDGLLQMLNIDFQFKYIDCPTEATVGYDTVTLKRGWNLIIKKNFAPWQIPNDAFQASDRLTGNNGSLRYTATNA